MRNEICTYTGKIFNFLNPKPKMVCIEDIAHSLSNLCRYTGHVKRFYSVGEHSILMALSNKCPNEPLSKLLHDAAEAYIGDIASPFKRILNVEGYQPEDVLAMREFEAKILPVISEALGVSINITAEIKKLDQMMGITEVGILMPANPISDFGFKSYPPLEIKLPCWKPVYVEQRFLKIFNQLKAKEFRC